MIRLAGIESQSIVDGKGIRYVIFTQGCTHNCNGCHNPDTHDIHGGSLVKVDDIIDDIKNTRDRELLTGVTFSGGDPVLQAKQLLPIAECVKDMGMDLWMYTGYTFENLMKQGGSVKELLKYVDVLVDGKYEEELKTLDKPFIGSSNQRIIDVKESIKGGEVVLYK